MALLFFAHISLRNLYNLFMPFTQHLQISASSNGFIKTVTPLTLEKYF
jgi:hypothetical protein